MIDTRMVSATRENLVIHHVMKHGISEIVYLKFPVRRTGYELTETEREKLKARMALNRLLAQQVRDELRGQGVEVQDKLDTNLSRVRKQIRVLGCSNEWDYFVTLTQSEKMRDRFDLRAWTKDFRRLIRRINTRHKRHGIEPVKYLLVFEKHVDGAWHMHGLVSGLTDAETRKFQLDEKLPKEIRKKLQDGQDVRDWTEYSEEFGWTVMDRVRSPEGVAKYVSKYITKDMQRMVTELGEHMYICSQGLSKGRKRAGTLMREPMQPADFSNDFVSIWRLRNPDEVSAFNESIAWDRPIQQGCGVDPTHTVV